MRMPVIFLAHGAPMLLDDAGWVGELARWARALPRPRAILVISAHWEHRPLTIGATTPLPLVYDFYGFPEKFYRLAYPSPGAPELAARVRGLLDGARIPWRDEPTRGLDHGVYVPLLCMYPKADVPVLQVSMPSLEPAELYAIGQTLAPLRDDGVLVIASGFLTDIFVAADGHYIPAPKWCAKNLTQCGRSGRQNMDAQKNSGGNGDGK